MQLNYDEKFPNARQHLTALPPLGEKHSKANHLLQKLTAYTESNFISTKVFCDKTTKKLRANLMERDGYHYNDWGVRMLAKEIKKSLKPL